MASHYAIVINAMIPPELLEKLTQHIRDFDTNNPGCYFQIWAHTDLSVERLREIIENTDPPFDHVQVLKKH